MKTLRDIPGYEGLYCVARDGSVWSYPNRIHSGIWLKPSMRKGYLFVSLCKGPEVRNSPIHKIVANTYIENPDNLPQINHIDGNKLNNHSINLEWCTASHNKKHSWDIGTSFVTDAKREASRLNAYKMHEHRRNSNV